MAWYNCNEQTVHNAHVLYTSTSFSRNISGLPFLPSTDRAAISDLIIKIGNILETKGFCIGASDGKSAAALRSYAEKQYTDPNSLSLSTPYAVYFNDPCHLSITIGGRDILTINSMLSGSNVTKSVSAAFEAERMLDSHFDFAFSERHGYLSPIPSHIGTGMRIRALLYLPSHVMLDRVDSLASSLSGSGFELCPLFCGAYPGDLFTLTYLVPQNTGKDTAAVFFSGTLERIVSEEYNREREAFAEDPILFEDRALRAQAIISSSITVSEGELLSLISDIRFFLANSANSANMTLNFNDLNYLLCEALNGSLALRSQKCPTGIREFNMERAAYLRQYISGRDHTA